MMLMSTGAAKYRMRILQAMRIAQVPEPDSLGIVAGWGLGVSWRRSDGRLATIVQLPGKPSHFGCWTYSHLTPITASEIDLDAPDGPLDLMEFLDLISGWLE